MSEIIKARKTVFSWLASNLWLRNILRIKVLWLEIWATVRYVNENYDSIIHQDTWCDKPLQCPEYITEIAGMDIAGVDKDGVKFCELEMWANAQRDGRPAEYRWRPLFNAAKFGWRPLLEYRAVTLPRRETRWNLNIMYWAESI